MMVRSLVEGGKILLVAVCLIAARNAHARASAAAHATDFIEVINGYDDYQLVQFYKKFSSDIDNNKDAEASSSISARIKRAIAAKYQIDVRSVGFHHKHRYIAHQWKYGGAIPREDLSLIERYYPDCRDDIIRIWQQFCKEKNDYITSEFALQRAPWIAKSYCAVLYYTHIIADWLPDANSDFDFLMPLDTVVAEIVGAVNSMGRSDEHKKFCQELEMKLKTAKALGGASPQQQAVKILEALKEIKLGTMIHERFGPYMDESRHPYHEDAGQQMQKAA